MADYSYLNDKTILVTGGTGTFGRAFVKKLLSVPEIKKVIIFSRDDFKQSVMQNEIKDGRLRYFLGDIRDFPRLERAFNGVDIVVHAAALKQVPALEYNPTEAVKTNVDGANNIVDAAIDAGVKKVIALSTDKAVNPINLYGATKLVAEKIFIAANAYGGGRVKFSVVRYGNVIGSRGSVIPLFMKLKSRGVKEFPVTDERMTRFWMTLEESVNLVLKALEESEGEEIFVPKISSMKIVDLARAIEPDCKFKVIGIRPGEKVHEVLISEDEARKTKIFDGIFVILPQFFESKAIHGKYEKHGFVPNGFIYRSDKNDSWYTTDKLRRMLEELKIDHDQAGVYADEAHSLRLPVY